MIQTVRHPFFRRDVDGIANHILDVTGGDVGAAVKRMEEIDALIASIVANPMSGTRLSPRWQGWMVRHGGTGQRLTIVFRPDTDGRVIYLASVAFGGRDWMRITAARQAYFD